MAAATVVGVGLGLTGAASSGIYAWSAAEVLGEADRSVVFWYSGFLVTGIAFSAGGVSLLMVLGADASREDPIVPRRIVRWAVWILGLSGGLAGVGGLALAAWHLLAE